jgi:hypothetical protein
MREERPIGRLQHLKEPQWQTHICSGATVGDSPRGPLKQLGNPHLKPATKPKPNTPRLTMQDTAHAVKAPMARQGGPLEDPLEQASPHSRMRAPPRAGSAPFEGVQLPRAGSASLEGPLRPRTGSASLEGAPHMHARSRTRAFNALTMEGRCHHAPGARAPVPPHQLPRREPIPATMGGLCGVAGASPVTPRRLLRYG